MMSYYDIDDISADSQVSLGWAVSQLDNMTLY